MFLYQVWVAATLFVVTANSADLPTFMAAARDSHPGATPSLTITEVK